MEFRPCIDIHDGKVKQIVGSTLKDSGNEVCENFVSDKGAAYFASLYRKNELRGGHVILLNKQGTKEYEASEREAKEALSAFPGGLQIGGGVNAENALSFIEAGASHVIVTSYVFRDGNIDYDRLTTLSNVVGKEHLVLDLSCKKKENGYVIVTDRWQKESNILISEKLLLKLEKYCDEFLIHAVDVEGKANGIETDLVEELAGFAIRTPITYAGGVHTYEDIKLLQKIGKGKVNVTIGSSLDLFGGALSFEKIMDCVKKE